MAERLLSASSDTTIGTDTKADVILVTTGAGDVKITPPDPALFAGRRLVIMKADSGAGEILVSRDDKGTGSYRCEKTIAAGTLGRVYLQDNSLTTDLHGLSLSTQYTFTAWLYIPAASGILGSEITLNLADYNSGWDVTSQAAANTYDAWQQVTVTRTLRGIGTTGARVYVNMASTADTNEYFWIDNLTLSPLGFDRGNCEEPTPPAVATEVAVTLSDANFYLDQYPIPTPLIDVYRALRIGLQGQLIEIMSDGTQYRQLRGVVQPIKGEPDVGGGYHHAHRDLLVSYDPTDTNIHTFYKETTMLPLGTQQHGIALARATIKATAVNISVYIGNVTMTEVDLAQYTNVANNYNAIAGPANIGPNYDISWKVNSTAMDYLSILLDGYFLGPK
jgi:hypothetical protein